MMPPFKASTAALSTIDRDLRRSIETFLTGSSIADRMFLAEVLQTVDCDGHGELAIAGAFESCIQGKRLVVVAAAEYEGMQRIMGSLGGQNQIPV